MIVASEPRVQQQGMSLILVVFILVILSLLGTVMLRMSAVSHDSVAREVLSTRALHAAESGAQRKLADIFTAGGGAAACTASTSYSFPSFTDCAAVTVQCSVVNISAVNYFTITSTGSCGPVGDAAVRRIEVQARDN